MSKHLVGVFTALALALVASAAMARGLTPMNGRALNSADETCFTHSWNRVSNNCAGGQRAWAINAPIDTGNNNHAIFVYGRGTGITVVRCTAQSNTPDGLNGAALIMDRASSTWGLLAPSTSSVWVPNLGTLHVGCDVPNPGGVSAVHYAQ